MSRDIKIGSVKVIFDDENLDVLSVTATDDGDGFFYIIETEKWCVDSPSELSDLVIKVEKMLK